MNIVPFFSLFILLNFIYIIYFIIYFLYINQQHHDLKNIL